METEDQFWKKRYERLLDELLVFYGTLGTLRAYDDFQEGISEKQLKEIIKTVDNRLQKLKEDGNK